MIKKDFCLTSITKYFASFIVDEYHNWKKRCYIPAERTPEEEIDAELKRMKNQIAARKRKRNRGNRTIVDSDASGDEQLLNEACEEVEVDDCNDEELLEVIRQKRAYRIM